MNNDFFGNKIVAELLSLERGAGLIGTILSLFEVFGGFLLFSTFYEVALIVVSICSILVILT